MDDYKEYTVTCLTDGCGNYQIPITLEAPIENPLFMCGVCAQPITEIQE